MLTPNAVLDQATLTELNVTLSGFAADDAPSYGKQGGVIVLQNFFTATGGLATMRTGELLSEAR